MEGGNSECTEHPKNQNSVICLEEDCRDICYICLLCLEKKHKNHKWTSLTTFKDNLNLSNKNKNLLLYKENINNTCEKMYSDLNKTLDLLMKKITEIKDNINIKVNDLIANSECDDINNLSRLNLIESIKNIEDWNPTPQEIKEILSNCEIDTQDNKFYFILKNDPEEKLTKKLQYFSDLSRNMSIELNVIENKINSLNNLFDEVKHNFGIFVYKIKYSELISQGWRDVYNVDYSSKTDDNVLQSINKNINTNSLICVGVIDVQINNDLFILCALDYARHALFLTPNPKVANKGEGAYWYRFSTKSFGFSPVENIDLACADQENEKSELRVSWCIHGSCAGSRVGDIKGCTNPKFKKVILLKP